jgi:DnaJ-class molecular chaperone
MDRPNEKDYYGLLGVPRDANLSTIRRAFRRLTRKLRPDTGGATTEQLDDLRAAYETLCDDERRKRYDESLKRTERADGPVSRESVDRPAGHTVAAGPLAGEIILSPIEAARGGVISLDVPVTARCRDCGGTGGRHRECGRCGGCGLEMRHLPSNIHIPPKVGAGTIFQVATGNPKAPYFLLSVQIRQA